jgi:hypothetical protein
MKHLMLDLETLGTTPDSVVVSMGAVFFDEHRLGGEFYARLDMQQQLRVGRKVSASTLQWWLKQNEAARLEAAKDGDVIELALTQFVMFVNSNNAEPVLWSNGPAFDAVIIESLMVQFHISVPWKFWNLRDFRTFKEFVAGNAPLEKTGVAHNALDDAKAQAKYVSKHLPKSSKVLEQWL